MRNAAVGLTICFLLLLVACGGGGGSSQGGGNNGPTISSIQITGFNGSVTAGQTQQLTATATYSDGSAKDVTATAAWSSSNTNIATVAAGGMLTAKASGQCSVSAKVGSVGGSASLTVTPSLVSISVTPSNPSIAANANEQFVATGTYSDNSTQNLTSQVTWSSSNTAVASVSTTAPSNGLAVAASAGITTISATLGSVSGSTQLTVTPFLVSVAVTPANPSIAMNTNQQFIATGTYSDNSTQNLTSQVTWASSNATVASVSTTAPTKGLAIGASAGTTTISATLGSVAGATQLTVTAASVTQITVTAPNSSLSPGLSQQYTANASFSDNTTQDITSVAQWHSSNSNVASITVSGMVTGRTLGSVTIGATFGGATGSAPLTVNAANVSSIAITPANGSIAQGTQIAFTATGTYTDGSTHDLSHVVTWSSDNTGALTIGSVTGVGNGIAPGQANVTATLGSLAPSVPVTVTDATIVSIAVSPANPSLPTGGRGVMTAVGTFSDSSTQNLSPFVTWSSDNTAAATVGTSSFNYGVVLALSAGTANISASFGYAGVSATGSTPLTITSATLASITMTPQTAVLAPGSAAAIAAYGNFTDGTVEWISPLCTWKSSSNTIATVSPNGLVGGQSAGVVTITAQDGSVTGTASVLVESAALSSIQVRPQNPSVPVGFDRAFAATGNFANGDTQDLTNFVAWTSSQPGIATVSNTSNTAGEATGIQPGTTTISAVFSGQVGTTTLTVTNATLTSITITPSTASIAVGSSQSFMATGNFSDGSSLDISRQVTWASSDPVVTIGSRGIAQGVAAGTSTISASVNGVTGSATLTVQ